MLEYFRSTVSGEPSDVPSDTFYEVDGACVLRLVELDRNGDIYWNDVRSYEVEEDLPGYPQTKSLKEFSFDIEKLRNPPTRDELWQRISADEFYSWFAKAHKFGRRRWECGIGVFKID